MDELTGTVVFFDVGDTLASVTLDPDGHLALAAYPYVAPVLEALRSSGARLGILADPDATVAEEIDRALEATGLRRFFAPELVIYGPKDSPAVFEEAARRAGGSGPHLFVGEDAGERTQALGVGFLVAPHPLLAVPVLEDRTGLRYVRVTVPPDQAATAWRETLRDLPVLPLHVTGAGGATIYAIATASAAARLDDLGFLVDRLGGADEPLTSALYLLRDDRQARSGFLRPEGNSAAFFAQGAPAREVLASTGDGLIVALPVDRSVEEYHFRGVRHGHNLKLVPSTGLLAPAPEAGPADRGRPITVAPAEQPSATCTLDPAAKEVLDARVRPEHIAAHVERYSGAQPVDSGGVVITSRHIAHPDNRAAVTALVADLQRIGGERLLVRRHRFGHGRLRLDNVVAEFPGTGLDGVVVISAHMDSTAIQQPGYRPHLDPAPGADDDASGTAAVLVAVDAIAALDAALVTPRRTVRFVLFNAEEDGLVGSKSYVRDEAALGTPIVAGLQLDMIGYDVRPGREWELHAGFTPSPDVQATSLELARTVADLAAQVSPDLPVPQIYPAGDGWDEAEERSDHHSFQAHGYPACLASEDLFAGPGPASPPAEMNPNYHSPADKAINAGYAADIARAVIATAWITATLHRTAAPPPAQTRQQASGSR